MVHSLRVFQRQSLGLLDFRLTTINAAKLHFNYRLGVNASHEMLVD